MILMLLCAKTARTDGRTIFQYVDLTAPNVAAGKNAVREDSFSIITRRMLHFNIIIQFDLFSFLWIFVFIFSRLPVVALWEYRNPYCQGLLTNRVIMDRFQRSHNATVCMNIMEKLPWKEQNFQNREKMPFICQQDGKPYNGPVAMDMIN